MRAGHDVLRGARVAPAGAGRGVGRLRRDRSGYALGRSARRDRRRRAFGRACASARRDGGGGRPHLHPRQRRGDRAARGCRGALGRAPACPHELSPRARPGESGAAFHGKRRAGAGDALCALQAPLRDAARGGGTRRLRWSGSILRPPMVYGPGRAATSAVWSSSCAPACRCRWARQRRPRASSASTTWPTPWCVLSSIRARPTRCSSLPTPRATSTAGLVRLIAEALGRRVWTPHVPAGADARRRSRWSGARATVQRLFDPLELDTSRIRTLLDWSPPVSLAEGVRRAVGEVAQLTRRPDRWARDSRWPAGWSRSPCRRRPSARRTSLPSCRPCAPPRRGWRCSSRSRW